MLPKTMDRRVPFQHRIEREEADRAITQRIEQQTRRLQGQVIPQANRQGLKHGRHWQTRFADRPDHTQEVKEHSTETELSFHRIVDNDLSILDEILIELPKRMHGQFMQSMYRMLEESTVHFGNIVSGKPFAESFIEILEKIAFGVDRWGIPTFPELHITPAMQKEVDRFIARPDPAYKERIERLTEAKKKEAIAHEARRISRFKLR